MEEGGKEEQGTCKNIGRAVDWDSSCGISSSFCGIFVQQCREKKNLSVPSQSRGRVTGLTSRQHISPLLSSWAGAV